MTTCNKKNDNDNLRKIKSGFFSGLINSTMFYPIDVMRVRYFFGKNIPQHKTTSAFTNGMAFNTITYSCKSVLTYGGQEYFKEQYLKTGYNQKYSQIYSSLTLGVIYSLASAPINAIKTPMQTSLSNTSWFQVSKNIYKKYGLNGFYRGASPLITRDMIWVNIYFMLYGFTKFHYEHLLPKSIFPKQNDTLASATSAMVSAVAVYPLDGMRLYRQHHQHDFNIWHGFKKSFELTSSNQKSFFTGIFRVTASVVVNHMLYLTLKDWF